MSQNVQGLSHVESQIEISLAMSIPGNFQHSCIEYNRSFLPRTSGWS